MKEGKKMLSSNLTLDDVLFILIMVVIIITNITAFNYGRQIGREEGLRAKRFAERQVRRLHW